MKSYLLLLRRPYFWTFPVFLGASLAASAAVWHVSPGGDDTYSGAAWTEAKRTVGAALAVAAAGDAVWVAAGTYGENLEMKPDVALYGGFAGGETSLAGRDWVRNVTVLDGETNGIVVLVSGGGSGTVVDGFTIRNGLGAGIRLYGTSAVIRNNVIRDNLSSAALAYGAGVSVRNPAAAAVATIERNVIIHNYGYDGGGIACIDASPRIAFNVIAWNFARQDGGGISCWRNSSPTIEGNVISANTAFTLDGVAVPVGGGGIFATADDLDGRPHPTAVSAPVIRNNVVVANGGWRGGGIALIDSNGGVPQVVNNTLAANSGAGLFWSSSALPSVALLPVVRNNLVAFNSGGLELGAGTPTNAVIQFNCVYGNRLHDHPGDYVGLDPRTGSDGNLALDPRLALYTYGDFHLQPGSPCIDAGTNLPGSATWLDVDGQSRIAGPRIDIGADESAGEVWPAVAARFHVRTNGSDSADGLSWSGARRTIQSAINAAMLRGGDVWVAAGVYTEHIRVPAFVHLYGGFSGTETDLTGRDPAAHPTVIDGAELPNVVVIQNGGFRVATVDGFTVWRGGRYTGGAGLNKYGRGGNGGGFHINLSGPVIAGNLIVSNSLAYDNVAPPPGVASYGAGIYCRLGAPRIVGNTIRDNEILNDFDGSGGGIYCDKGSSPWIEGNQLIRNQAAYGPAIYAVLATPVIRGNRVESNAFYNTYPLPLYLGAVQGAVTLRQNEECTVEGNVFRGNTAGAGAALYAAGGSSGRVQNNLFLNNRAYDPTAFGGTGGGIYWVVLPGSTSTVSVVHNTFFGNVASNSFSEQGGAIAFVLNDTSNRLVLANNIVLSNSSGFYQMPSTPLVPPVTSHNNLMGNRSNYINLPEGVSDLHVDPGFLGADDWRLASQSACVDAGSVDYAAAEDLDGVPRPLDGNNDGQVAPDLGAYETVHPQGDSDRDRMPDGWELAHALNPLEDDAGLDADGDRATNIDEYLAGTVPDDPVSVLALGVAVDPAEGRVRLRWFGVAGRAYTLEYADQLPGPLSWPVLTGSLPGGDAPLEWTDTPVAGRPRFYRVRAASGP